MVTHAFQHLNKYTVNPIYKTIKISVTTELTATIGIRYTTY